jgi:hypothetical protein
MSPRSDAGHGYGRRGGFELTYEPVTALGDCLDESRLRGGVAQRFPQPGDGAVQAVVEVYKCIRWPKFYTQLFARNHFTGSLDQQKQNTERLFLYLDVPTFHAQFPCPKVNLKYIEADHCLSQTSI